MLMLAMRRQVGLQLRNADPGLMKEFVLGVHERAAQLGKDGAREGMHLALRCTNALRRRCLRGSQLGRPYTTCRALLLA